MLKFALWIYSFEVTNVARSLIGSIRVQAMN